MDINQCIFPIYNGTTIVGQGFVADGFFITVAHILKNYPSCYINLNGNKIELFNEASFWWRMNYQYAQKEDIVKYQFEGTSSKLHLSEHIPQKNERLEVYFTDETKHSSSLNDSRRLSIEPAYLLERDESNSFYCECNLPDNCCGSPLIKGNEVVGIMIGRNDKGICSFLKMGSVLYEVGNYYFNNVNDLLEHSNVFHAIPTPDYKTAIKWYLKAASNHFLEAFYKIGYCYESGKGVDKNMGEAVNWYKRAATLGHVQSQYELGKHYLEGNNVLQDYEKATYWLRLAAENKHALSLYELGVCSYNGIGFTKSYGNAIEYFSLAITSWKENTVSNSRELHYAYYYLGRCYLEYNNSQFSQYASLCFQEAGDIEEALYYLGLCYYNGWGIPKNDKKAFELFQKVSGPFGQISEKASYFVAMYYYNGIVVEKDYKESVKWLKKAYDFDEALFQLGMCYYLGHGVEKGYDEALKYFKKAANTGHVAAQKKVGELYRKLGEGYKDRCRIEEAIKWNKKMLEQGNTDLLWEIGYCYETMGNIGYEEKYEDAIEWYKQALTQGDADALLSLKSCYEAIINMGHTERCEEAINLYKQAWDQGFAEALRYIGNCYEIMFKMGNKERMNDAVFWYKKAAAFNDSEACVSLVKIYKHGIGVPKNVEESERWIDFYNKNNSHFKFRAELACKDMQRLQD